MLDLDRQSYQSPLRRQDPIEKFFYVGLMIGYALWTTWAMGHLLVIGLMVGGLRYMNKTPYSQIIKLFLIPLGFLALGVMTLVISVTPEADGLVWSLPLFDQYIGVSHVGVQQALRILLRSLSCVSGLYYLILTTPFTDLVSGLKRLKCPTLLIELMHLMYKMIFLLLDTTQTIYQAQRSRLGYRSYGASFGDMATLASMTFIRAFRRADALYTALESRGYTGELRVMEERFPVTLWGYLIPVVLLTALVGLTLI